MTQTSSQAPQASQAPRPAQPSQSSQLSISVVSYDSPQAELERLVESLAENLRKLSTAQPDFSTQIYFLDNSDTTPLEPAVIAIYRNHLADCNAQVELIQGQGNVGYGKANNLAIQRSESQYHLVLNPDVVLEPDCLLHGIEYLQENPETVAVSPAAKSASGEKQYLCKRYPSVGLFLLRGFAPRPLKALFHRSLQHFEMRDLPETQASEGIPIISGCFMLCRADALKAVQGFDDNYFLYFEDFDLSLRLGQLGKLAHVPTMQITHDGGNSASKGFAHIRMFARSGARFFATHGWRFF